MDGGLVSSGRHLDFISFVPSRVQTSNDVVGVVYDQKKVNIISLGIIFESRLTKSTHTQVTHTHSVTQTVELRRDTESHQVVACLLVF